MWTWLAALLMTQGLTVKDMGYCPDVSSPSCPVRAYWPRSYDGTGTEAYWLQAVGSPVMVCFVTRKVYGEAVIGRPTSCWWRERH